MSASEPAPRKASGLRQRKKAETRRHIAATATRLFQKQGYDQTTLEHIADRASVSVPTVLVYFESKERLALAAEYAMLAALEQLLGEEGRTTPALSLWRDFVEVRAAAVSEQPAEYVRRLAFCEASPVLARGLLSIVEQQESIVTQALAQDFDTDPATDLATQLLATILTFGTQTAVRHWAREGGHGDLTKQVLAVVDFAAERFPTPGQPLVR